MKWSLKIARISGIDVFLHWTFLVLLAFVLISSFSGGIHAMHLEGFWFILLLFVFVLLHEFGHALVGQRFGVKTANITLLPIGGVANMERMPEKPWQELAIALAGPLVNLGLALLFLIYLAISHQLTDFYILSGPDLEHSLSYNLFTINLILFGFNLVPAFPMDGGRVLRALLELKFPRHKATNIAARIGQLLAMAFILYGLFNNIWFVFIGIFIYLGAGAEANYEANRSVLVHYTVKDVVMHQFSLLQSHDSIDKAVKLLLDGSEKEFLVQENGIIAGTINRENLIEGLGHLGKDALLSEIMNRNVIKLKPEMPLDEAYELFSENQVEICPVLNGDELVGVLNRENIMEVLLIANTTGQNIKRDNK
jgi:Zn-dependent protease